MMNADEYLLNAAISEPAIKRLSVLALATHISPEKQKKTQQVNPPLQRKKKSMILRNTTITPKQITFK